MVTPLRPTHLCPSRRALCGGWPPRPAVLDSPVWGSRRSGGKVRHPFPTPLSPCAQKPRGGALIPQLQSRHPSPVPVV